jgi:hypothetical protein
MPIAVGVFIIDDEIGLPAIGNHPAARSQDAAGDRPPRLVGKDGESLVCRCPGAAAKEPA